MSAARGARRWRWVPWSVTVLMLAAAVVMPTPPPGPESTGGGFFLMLAAQALTFATVGLLLIAARPGNAVSWLFVWVGLVVALYLLVARYHYLAREVVEGLPGVEATAWVQTWLYVPALGAVTMLLPLLFPTGRLLSPRWRPALALSLAGALGTLLSDALRPGAMDDTGVINPFGLDPTAYGWLNLAAGLCFAGGAIAGVASLVARWRASSHVERQQLKWFGYFAAIIPLFVVVAATSNIVGYQSPVRTAIVTVVAIPAFLGLPVGVAISILRHQLYDIDLVIKRTVVYATLTATLVVAYLASVLLMRVTLSPLTGRSDLAVAGSTLAVAALFRPLRGRIQRIVDRRFFRSRYDAQRTVERFAGRLRDELDIESMSADLRSVAHRTMQPSHVSLWLVEPRRER